MFNRLVAPLAVLAGIALSGCADSSVSPLNSEDASLSMAAKPGSATIVELALATDALSTLVFAIGESDTNCGTSFASVLSGNGQYTVFAPTNAAFGALIDALGAETVLSCDVLPTVLAFHVARGRLTSTAVLNRRSIRMLSGESAAVSGTTVAGARLNLGLVDISASNGIVHVVDDVLIPGSILAALN
jgi:transforming growth factor-beta-induced protein